MMEQQALLWIHELSFFYGPSHTNPADNELGTQLRLAVYYG